MRLRILGSAAGGGFPQWNCNCPGCQAVRDGHPGVHSCTQSSIAIQAASESWFLVNASPDIRQQLEQLRDLPPNSSPTTIRSSPIAGIVLSDAEIDHTAGLMILRESVEPLQIYSTETVRKALTEGFPLLRVLKDYCGVQWFNLEPGSSIYLGNHKQSSLVVEPFLLPAKPPKYMRSSFSGEGSWVVGLTFRDLSNGSILTYAPALADLSNSVLERFAASDCILVDGTCWQDSDLVNLGMSTRTARSMGHLPLSGADGSLVKLAQLSRPRKILIHINNTNPILIPGSVERQQVEASGVEVGYDGLMIEL
ncbi:MAG: pyrroloquinoline quinone biosynthesis protein PqqB [Microcoleaceae cyanobacterium]